MTTTQPEFETPTLDGGTGPTEFEPVAVESLYREPVIGVDPDADLGWLKRLLPLVKVYRLQASLGIFVGLIAVTLNIAGPAVARSAIDATRDGQRGDLTTWVIVLVGIGVARFVFGAIYRYALFHVAWNVETDLRALLYRHLTTLSFSYYDRTQSGQVISRANSDIRSIQLLLAFGPLVGMSLVSFVIAFAYMMTIHIPLTLVALSTLPGVYYFGQRLRDIVFPLSWVGQARMAELATIVDENVNGTRVVKSFAAERRQIKLLTEAAQHLRWANVEAIRARARYNPFIESLPRLAMAGVLVYGGWLAIDGQVSVGTLFAFNAYVIMLQVPFRMFGFLLLQAQRASASAQRVFEVLDEDPEIADAPGATDLVVRSGAIRFSGVDFTYPTTPINGDASGSRPSVLTGLDLEVASGETVAIVGRTGSGKSTVARLLARFYEVDAGTITIDGADISQVTLASLRHHVGLVFDEPFLFSTSVRDNIAYGRPRAELHDVKRAATAAQAHAFIEELDHGYDTVVGERGYTLSGGQRQRIAIARTLLENPPILVLDDATSAIDVRVEAAIHDSLQDLLDARTTILIAHRLSTIALADRVVLLEDGAIVASGTHQDLLANEPRYVQILAEAEDDELDPDEPTPQTGPKTGQAR